MTELAELQRRLAAALAGDDAEHAAQIQREIDALPLPPSKLRVQVPGKMGLGTSEQAFRPPPGWKPPKKPDPMTAGHKPRRGGRD